MESEGFFKVKNEHMESAIRLFTSATVEASSHTQTVEVQEFERPSVRECEAMIRTKVSVGNKVQKDALFTFLKDNSIEDRIAKITVHIMLRKGELEEASHNTLKRNILG